MKFRRWFLIISMAPMVPMGIALIFFPQARALIPGYQSAMAKMHQSHHGVSQFCHQENPEEHIDQLKADVEQRLSLSTDQTASLNQVTDALKTSSADFKATCAKADENAAAPDQLAQLETTMTTGLKAVQEVREPFNAFYNSLSPEQQTTLNEAIADHGKM